MLYKIVTLELIKMFILVDIKKDKFEKIMNRKNYDFVMSIIRKFLE